VVQVLSAAIVAGGMYLAVGHGARILGEAITTSSNTSVVARGVKTTGGGIQTASRGIEAMGRVSERGIRVRLGFPNFLSL
jgi:hypothetical protein